MFSSDNIKHQMQRNLQSDNNRIYFLIIPEVQKLKSRTKGLVSGEDVHVVYPMWKVPMAERQRWPGTQKEAKQRFFVIRNPLWRW